jgi:hypothetical protein
VNGVLWKRWLIGLGALAAVLGCMVAGSILAWRALLNAFVHQYYRVQYHPVELEASQVGNYPPEHHLQDVPWISTREAVCQSTSLQMIAAQQGIVQPRHHFDFLMGFTYGASQEPGTLAFYPGTDPEPGFAVAAPYLGMVRRYYVTDNDVWYLSALRYYLSRGYPVRLGLDMGVLHDVGEDTPHSEVLTGYDGEGFYYYETVCLSEVPCEPGQLPPGERGLYTTNEKLLDAVLGQARLLDYPWRYSLSIFEPAVLEEDLRPIWARNGQSLIGGNRYGPKQGADVIDGLAEEIEGRGTRFDASEMEPGLTTAVYVRQENAAYLRGAFPGDAELDRAADLFDQAAGNYEAVLDAIEGGITSPAEATQIAGWLHEAATAERAVGEILLARRQR